MEDEVKTPEVEKDTQPIVNTQQTRADRLREASSAPDFSMPEIRPASDFFSESVMSMDNETLKDMMRETGIYASTSKQVSTAIGNALMGMNQLGDEMRISYGNLTNYLTGSSVGDEMAKIAYDSITQRYAEMANREEEIGGIRSELAQLAGGATSFVQLALEGLATGGALPLAHIGVQEFGQGTYNDMKAYADEHEGSLKGYKPKGFDIAANTANALLQVGIESWLGVGSPRFLVGASRGLWVEGLSGALQEGVQGALSDLTEAVKGNQDVSILLDNAEDYLRDAIVGGILQGSLGAVTHHQNYARSVDFTSQALAKARGHERPTAEDKQQAKAIIDAKERQESSIMTKEFKAAFDASTGEGQLQQKIVGALKKAVEAKELDLNTTNETEMAQRIEQIATQETLKAMDFAREQNRSISDMELNNIVYKDGAIWLEGLTPELGDKAVGYARVLAERQSGLAEARNQLDAINAEIKQTKADLAEATAQNQESRKQVLQKRIDKQNAIAKKNRLQAQKLEAQTAELEKQIANQTETEEQRNEKRAELKNAVDTAKTLWSNATGGQHVQLELDNYKKENKLEIPEGEEQGVPYDETDFFNAILDELSTTRTDIDQSKTQHFFDINSPIRQAARKWLAETEQGKRLVADAKRTNQEIQTAQKNLDQFEKPAVKEPVKMAEVKTKKAKPVAERKALKQERIIKNKEQEVKRAEPDSGLVMLNKEQAKQLLKDYQDLLAYKDVDVKKIKDKNEKAKVESAKSRLRDIEYNIEYIKYYAGEESTYQPKDIAEVMAKWKAESPTQQQTETQTELTKSKKRVQESAEVYTPKWVVNEMLDLIPAETWENIDATFLEPAGGNGNFVEEILRRKLAKANTTEEKIRALKSVYAIELMLDNVDEMRTRVKLIMEENGITEGIDYIIKRNIQQGNFLSKENIFGEDISFYDWVNEGTDTLKDMIARGEAEQQQKKQEPIKKQSSEKRQERIEKISEGKKARLQQFYEDVDRILEGAKKVSLEEIDSEQKKAEEVTNKARDKFLKTGDDSDFLGKDQKIYVIVDKESESYHFVKIDAFGRLRTINEYGNNNLYNNAGEGYGQDVDNLSKLVKEFPNIEFYEVSAEKFEALSQEFLRRDYPDMLLQGTISGKGDTARGGYDEQLKRIILGEKSDLSTIQHEFAHYWIQNNFKWARSGLASQDWLRRWRDVEEWLGIEPQDRLLSKSASEKFAKAYERYILEGKVAPELQWAFEGFQKAYQDIYDDLEKEYFDLEEELAPEVIDWFNRNKEQSPKRLLQADEKKLEKALTLAAGGSVIEEAPENTIVMTEQNKEGDPVVYMGVKQSEVPAGDNLLVQADKTTASKLQQSARKYLSDKVEVQQLATLDTQATLKNFKDWIARDRQGAWNAMMNPDTRPIYKTYLYKAFSEQAMNDVNLAMELANVNMAESVRELGQAIQALNIRNESGFDMIEIIRNLEKSKGELSEEELNNSIAESGVFDVELSEEEMNEIDSETECKL